MNAPRPHQVLRSGEHGGRVTNIELFFDLVYVFAITQLSSLLETSADGHALGTGAIDAAILLGLVWQAWAYTTWVTNWLDPDRLPARIMMLGVMLASLIFSAFLPDAFAAIGPDHHVIDRGLAVAITYVVIQVGRSIFAVIALHGEPQLRLNFQRILLWSCVSSAAMIIGAETHGHARQAIWAGAVLFDVVGGRVGFWTPVLGRAHTDEWTIDGAHFAERCQGFVLIALGESIVVIGSALAGHDLSASVLTSFVMAFVGSALLWWIYFDQVAERSARVTEQAEDPGRLGATAYHLVHPVIVAGVVLCAASDHVVLAHPSERGVGTTSWLLLGGVALFLLGHAAFKAIVFGVVPTTRLVAAAVTLALFAIAPHVTAIVLAGCVVVVLAVLVVSDRLLRLPEAQRPGPADQRRSVPDQLDGRPQ